jgi:hypothetical protein
MKVGFMSPSRRLVSIASVGATLALTSVALAAPLLVTVKVKGDYATRHRSACHEANKFFAFFHRAATIEWEGIATPASATHFAVRLEVKRCIGNTWVKVKDRFTTGKPLTGDFRGFFGAKPLAPRSHKSGAIKYFRARAIVGGTRSLYEYFAVTN